MLKAYSDPGASGGIDLDSDLITELATECPSVVGVKLTYATYMTCVIPCDVINDTFHAGVATSGSSQGSAQPCRTHHSRRTILGRIQQTSFLSWEGTLIFCYPLPM